MENQGGGGERRLRKEIVQQWERHLPWTRPTQIQYSTTYPPAPPGVIPELKVRSKPWMATGMDPKPNRTDTWRLRFQAWAHHQVSPIPGLFPQRVLKRLHKCLIIFRTCQPPSGFMLNFYSCFCFFHPESIKLFKAPETSWTRYAELVPGHTPHPCPNFLLIFLLLEKDALNQSCLTAWKIPFGSG